MKVSSFRESVSQPTQTLVSFASVNLSERKDDTLYFSEPVRSSSNLNLAKPSIKNNLVAVTGKMYKSREFGKSESQELDSKDWTIPPNAVLIRKLPDPLTLANVSGGPDDFVSGGKEENNDGKYSNSRLFTTSKPGDQFECNSSAHTHESEPEERRQRDSDNNNDLSVSNEMVSLENTPKEDKDETFDDQKTSLRREEEIQIEINPTNVEISIPAHSQTHETIPPVQQHTHEHSTNDAKGYCPPILLGNSSPDDNATKLDDVRQTPETIPQLEFDCRQVAITIGRTQVLQTVDLEPEHTIVHVKVWNEYLQIRRVLGQTCSIYRRFRQGSKEWQKSQRKILQAHGKSIEVVGPFPIHIQLDAVTVLTSTYITTDDQFGYQFVVSGKLWQPAEVKSIKSIGKKEQRIDMESNCHAMIHMRNVSTSALIDTGAGPSVMSYDMYKAVGGQDQDLTGTTNTLNAANNTALNVAGITKMIPFRIGNADFEMKFTICRDLCGTIILGRDYLTAYDIMVDLTNKRLIVRDPHRRFTIHETIMDSCNNIHVGTATNMFRIDEQGILVAEFKIKPRRFKQTVKTEPWLACVQGKNNYKLERQGIRLAKTVAIIKNDKVYVPILNVGLNPGFVEPKNARIRLSAARVEYSRSLNANEIRDTGSCQAIQLRENLREGRSMVTDLSIASDQETLETRTNFPLEEAREEKAEPKKKEFLTRPSLEKIKEQITPEQLLSLSKTLDDYDSLFSKFPSDVGRTDLLEHDIELEADAVPFKEPLRRVGPERQRISDEQVKLLAEMGMIRPSKSPFASAVVLVKKSDGNMRFCVDFRRLNDITVKDSFPLPVISEHLDKLGTAKYFTSLDMGNAFWQVPLAKESIPKTAFTTADNLWEWTRMPFGLCNATATFQRLMSRTIGNITSKYGNLVLCYVDDILIATNTVEQHVERLREVFECLSRAGLKLKASKCKIMDTSVKFLGRTVSEAGITPDAAQIQKVLDWQTPTDRSQLESFIGLANYYREFIKDFAKISAPLNKLKGRNSEFIWTEETENAFNAIKTALTTEPVLALPNEDGDFILDTDASAVAIAGILHQRQVVRGQEKLVVINYGSRGLRNSERNYGAAKLEMLAALIFIEHNRKFLYGRHFLIRCDNQAFSWLKTYSTKSEHVNRWIARLDGFDFTIEHRDRSKHTNADGLSKKTEYYMRRENHVCLQHMEGFKFLPQAQFDELPILTKAQVDRKLHEPPVEVKPKTEAEHTTVCEAEGACAIAENVDDRQSPLHVPDVSQRPNVLTNCGEGHSSAILLESSSPNCNEVPNVKEANVCEVECGYESESKHAIHQIFDECLLDVEVIQVKARYDHAELKKAQGRDVVTRAFIKLTTGEGNVAEWRQDLSDAERTWYDRSKKDLKINDQGVLVKKIRYRDGTDIGMVVVLPIGYQLEAIRSAHDEAGHFGQHKTHDNVITRFTWPEMSRDIARYVNSCPHCQKGKANRKGMRFKMKPILTTRPNELLIIDFLKLSVSYDGHVGLIVMIDHFSKYAQAVPLQAFTAAAAADAICKGWICNFGIPDRILSDQGSQFESALFKEFLEVFGIQKSHSTAYHPQTNGLVERHNRTILQMLRVACS